jgi:hypothetical protein
MIKKDATVRYGKEGLFRPNWIFAATKGRRTYSSSIADSKFAPLLQQQKGLPVEVIHVPEREWYWWMFGDEFYWTNESYNSPDEIRALIQEAAQKKYRRIQRAFSVINPERETHVGREPISNEVKTFVWNRDGGKCVNCGSREKLEYDHDIPVSKGGSNTARNIRLLCETCNRSKGASLI